MAKTPVKTAPSPAPKEKAPPSGTTLASNRKASYEYEIVERYEAGVVLSGTEIKSIRAGKADIGDAYVRLEAGEGRLIGEGLLTRAGDERTGRLSWRAERFAALNRPDRNLTLSGSGTVVGDAQRMTPARIAARGFGALRVRSGWHDRARRRRGRRRPRAEARTGRGGRASTARAGPVRPRHGRRPHDSRRGTRRVRE